MTTSINYFNQEQQTNCCNNMIAKTAMECIETAGKCNGYVFGGYVRDVILPSLSTECKIQDLKFKDIDLWFTEESDANTFIHLMGSSLVSNCRHTIDKSSVEYPFVRKQFYVTMFDTVFFWIDVIICNHSPVNDFDINDQYWTLSRDKFRRVDFKTSDTSLDFTSKNIVMKKDYIPKLSDPRYKQHGAKYNLYFMRVINRFLLEGYCITVENCGAPSFKKLEGESLDSLLDRYNCYIRRISPNIIHPVPNYTQAALQSLSEQLKVLTDKVEKMSMTLQ